MVVKIASSPAIYENFPKYFDKAKTKSYSLTRDLAVCPYPRELRLSNTIWTN